MLIDKNDSFLLIIDMQEKLVPKIHDAEKVIVQVKKLIKSAHALQIPVLCTEHCPDKIGHTTPALKTLLNKESIISKTHFSACLESLAVAEFEKLNRSQVIIAGAETHVCVLQTTLLLKQSGYQPYLVADATSARRPENKELALARLRQNSVNIVSSEMAMFEWLKRADTPSFRELLPLIRDQD